MNTLHANCLVALLVAMTVVAGCGPAGSEPDGSVANNENAFSGSTTTTVSRTLTFTAEGEAAFPLLSQNGNIVTTTSTTESNITATADGQGGLAGIDVLLLPDIWGLGDNDTTLDLADAADGVAVQQTADVTIEGQQGTATANLNVTATPGDGGDTGFHVDLDISGTVTLEGTNHDNVTLEVDTTAAYLTGEADGDTLEVTAHVITETTVIRDGVVLFTITYDRTSQGILERVDAGDYGTDDNPDAPESLLLVY